MKRGGGAKLRCLGHVRGFL